MYHRFGWETLIGQLACGVGDGKVTRSKSLAWFHTPTHLHFDNLPELIVGYNNMDSLQCVVCPLSFYDCSLNIRSL